MPDPIKEPEAFRRYCASLRRKADVLGARIAHLKTAEARLGARLGAAIAKVNRIDAAFTRAGIGG